MCVCVCMCVHVDFVITIITSTNKIGSTLYMCNMYDIALACVERKSRYSDK